MVLEDKARKLRRDAGLTLLEVSVALFLGAVLMLLVGMVLLGSQGLSADIRASTRGTAEVSRVLDALTAELMSGVQVVAFNQQIAVVKGDLDVSGQQATGFQRLGK